MAFCSNCGSELRPGAKFCENCGAPAEVIAAPAEQVVYEQDRTVNETVVVDNGEQNSLSKSALIWSIVGLALSELGVPGIIVSAIAKGKVKKAAAAGATGGKIKTARILSKIGMIVSIVMTVFWFIYAIVMGVAIVYAIKDSNGLEEIGRAFRAF